MERLFRDWFAPIQTASRVETDGRTHVPPLAHAPALQNVLNVFSLFFLGK